MRGDLDEVGRSSPSLHCPQNAVVAQANTAASRLELGSSLSCKRLIMVWFTGMRGGHEEEGGERRDTPLRT